MTSYELLFLVDGVNEDRELSLINDGINLLTVGQFQQVYVDADGEGVLDAIESACARLERHGVRPQRLLLDLVSQSDIAERAGVSKVAVGKWVACRDGVNRFPRQVGMAGSRLVWSWGEVNDWLKRTAKDGFDRYQTLSPAQVEQGNMYMRERKQLSRDANRVMDKVQRPAPRVEFQYRWLRVRSGAR